LPEFIQYSGLYVSKILLRDLRLVLFIVGSGPSPSNSSDSSPRVIDIKGLGVGATLVLHIGLEATQLAKLLEASDDSHPFLPLPGLRCSLSMLAVGLAPLELPLSFVQIEVFGGCFWAGCLKTREELV